MLIWKQAGGASPAAPSPSQSSMLGRRAQPMAQGAASPLGNPELLERQRAVLSQCVMGPPHPLSPLRAGHGTPGVVSCPVLGGARLWLVGGGYQCLGSQGWPWHGMQAVCIPALGACSHPLILTALVLCECMVGHLPCETEVSPLKIL